MEPLVPVVAPLIEPDPHGTVLGRVTADELPVVDPVPVPTVGLVGLIVPGMVDPVPTVPGIAPGRPVVPGAVVVVPGVAAVPGVDVPGITTEEPGSGEGMVGCVTGGTVLAAGGLAVVLPPEGAVEPPVCA